MAFISLNDLPDGVFKTLLGLWDTICSTYVTFFEWLGEQSFNSDFSVLSTIVGSGIFIVVAYTLVKWLIPM